ncbi:MAG: hypothetical protein WA102_05075 [Candidatus Methanoperedens sp.]
MIPSSTPLAASSGSASISAPICLQNRFSLAVLLQSPQSCSMNLFSTEYLTYYSERILRMKN